MKEVHSKAWYRAKHNPKYDMVHGDRLFYVESGCELGGQDEDGTMWYRISLSLIHI